MNAQVDVNLSVFPKPCLLDILLNRVTPNVKYHSFNQPNTDMLMWMNLQRDYDMWLAKKAAINLRIKPLKAA